MEQPANFFPQIISADESLRNRKHNAQVLLMEQVWIHFEARRRELYLGTELLAKIETAIKHPCTICKQEMELSTPANAGTGIHSNCFVPWYWKEWAIDIIAGVL